MSTACEDFKRCMKFRFLMGKPINPAGDRDLAAGMGEYLYKEAGGT